MTLVAVPRRLSVKNLALTLASGAMLASLLVVATPDGAFADPAPFCPDDELPMVSGEAMATQLAVDCAVEVEVVEESTEFGGVFAQPDGEMILRVGAEPYRARDDAGQWAEIDTDLVVNSDGSLSPRNSLTDVTFSSGGDGPFAMLSQDGKTLGLGWSDDLPEPSVSGNEVTFPDVLPDIDLVVRALPDGFSHDFVVHTAEAAANPELAQIEMDVEHDGLDVSVAANGAIEVTDSDTGEQFSVAPTPMMWDTPSAEVQTFASSAVEEQQIAELGVEFADGVLALTPDAELLFGDDTQFPVTIDPIWSGAKRSGEWGMVWSKFASQISWKGSSPSLGNPSGSGDAGAGQTCDYYTQLSCNSETYRMRSFFRMNTEPVTRNANREVLSASFKILQKHSASCDAGKARLWRTEQITASHSWNNQPSWLSDTVDSAASANNGGSCGGNKYAKFNVTSIVRKVAASQNYSVTFGLRAVNESPSPALAQWRRYDSSTAVLEISYNSYAQTPINVDTHGKGCSTDPAKPLTFTTGSVKFTGTPRDPDGKVYPQFRVREANGDVNIRTYQPSAQATSGKPFTWSVNPPLPDGDYRWRMRSGDNHVKSDTPYSSYTAYCYFKVDTEPPAQPEAIMLTDDPMLGESVRFELTGSADTHEFHYALTHGPSQRVAASNGKAVVTLTPPTNSIDHILQVWVRDSSGNESRRFDLLFTTRLPGEISWWPLAGDGQMLVQAVMTWTFPRPPSGALTHLDSGDPRCNWMASVVRPASDLLSTPRGRSRCRPG